MTIARPHLLHRAGVPHLNFPAYTRAEALSIISKTPLSLYSTSADASTPESQVSPPPANEEDLTWLWARFIAAVWDSLGQGAARDIISFREVCLQLWRPFTQPILDGHYWPREFSKLLVKNRALLQSEATLVDSIVPIAPGLQTSEPNPCNPSPALRFPLLL